MSMLNIFLKELESEAITTRKMLSIVPNDKFQWKPHQKSMSIQQLTTHIAELPTWIPYVLNSNELDFAITPYTPVDIQTTSQLLAHFEESLATGKAALENASEDNLGDTWTLRNGEDIYSSTSKAEFIRITFSQIVHHRAQLGVFLRLLDIPIPGSYGPSADEAY